jgi:hypothetical protein
MRKKSVLLHPVVVGLAFTVGTILQAQQPDRHGPPEIVIHLPNPYGGFGPLADDPGGPSSQARPGGGGGGGGKPKSNGIDYHGGPVMNSGTINVYFIWYGSWTFGGTPTEATTILTDFATHIGGSAYFNINTSYYDGNGARVINHVVYQGSTVDNYSQGSVNLSDGAIQSIVSAAIGSGNLGAPDPNGVYFVLTSADVTKSGFCSSYCGWHTYGIYSDGSGSTDIKYSFVGNPAQCISACAAQSVGPNGNAGADGMVSIIAHELEEAATDPDLDAWWDRRGYENADKCAWTFGTTYTVSNGAKANMKLGTRDFLIQRNWVNAAGGYCALSY